MPYDVRQVTFSRHEVVEAIVELSRANVTSLPPGKIVEIEFGGAAKVTVTLGIRQNPKSPLVVVTLPDTAVAAALILYCVNRAIPLPAKAEKRLERDGDSISLVSKQKLKPRRI